MYRSGLHRLSIDKIAVAIIIALLAFLYRKMRARYRRWRRDKNIASEQPFRKEQTRVSLQFLDAASRECMYCVNNYFVVQGNGVSTYKELLTTEGEIENELVEPGEIVEKRFDYGHFNYLIDLGKSYEKGERLRSRFQALLLESFPAARELWTHEVLTRTNQLCISVRFHRDRPPVLCGLYKRQGAGYVELPHAVKMACDSQGISAEVVINEPRTSDIYKIE